MTWNLVADYDRNNAFPLITSLLINYGIAGLALALVDLSLVLKRLGLNVLHSDNLLTSDTIPFH